jgi:hypothetical protein
VISSPGIPADLVCRLEAHAGEAWPATVTERVDGGWMLRATPGLGRGRSNHALPPCRALWAEEIPATVGRVEAFAERQRHPDRDPVQVEESNAPAVAMYGRLGFGEAYRYCHRVAPERSLADAPG